MKNESHCLRRSCNMKINIEIYIKISLKLLDFAIIYSNLNNSLTSSQMQWRAVKSGEYLITVPLATCSFSIDLIVAQIYAHIEANKF